jgi:translation initiation factor IF-3
VRCIDANGDQAGIIKTGDALRLAQQQGLDLVEISPTSKPPVCRIMDYGKYKYEVGKKERAAKKNKAATRVKEIKFHVNVGEHDYQTKLRHTREFLEQGYRCKVSLWFRGREGIHREFGYEVLNRVIQDCEDLANVEQHPQLYGRNLIMRITPKPAKPGTKKKAEPKPASEG